MGSLHARNVARRVEGGTLVAVADVERAAVERAARNCEVDAVYDDYREMLAGADVDAVVICTPPDTHAGIIIAAAGAGKHIFCEKPLALEVETADRALAVVGEAGVKLQVGFNRRFDRNFRRLRDAVISGETGDPITVHIVSRDPVRSADETPSFEPDMFLDTTIHDLDMARFLTGSEVESVRAIGITQEAGADTPNTALTLLRMTGGAVVTIENSWLSAYGYDQRAEVFGPRGTVSVENEFPHAATFRGGAGALSPSPLRFFTDRYADSYVVELSAFVECVLGSAEPEVSGEDGRVATILALAARLSWREGRAVLPKELAG